eukprot:XP_016660958.1 PREDICTED: calcitonin gene-related peptide type 1 receptor-like [Acyrthosiphon pisum]
MSDSTAPRVYDSNTLFLMELQQKCLPNATVKTTKNSCPRYFDGWACWEETSPNTTAFAQCPYYVVGFDPSKMSHQTGK